MTQASLLNGPVSSEEVRKELDAVLRSPTFERAERLQRFLTFVCERTLRGEGSRINEYLIGAEVFERGADYNPHEDSVVRRQAHALRRKLHEYYEKEGRNDSVRIDLPVGHYVPVFRHAEAEPPAAALAAFRLDGTPIGARGGWKFRVVTMAATAAIAAGVFVAGWLIGSRGKPAAAAPPLPPPLQEFWGPWFEDRSGATLCFSNPVAALVMPADSPAPRGLPGRFQLPPAAEKDFRSRFNLQERYLHLVPAMVNAKMGEAIAAVHLASLFGRAGVPLRTTQSRFLDWEYLRRENLILLGHNTWNRWVDPLLDKYPFRMVVPDDRNARRIVNSEPEPGEPADYRIESGGDSFKSAAEYALISMVPGVDGRRKLLLINGLNTQATQVSTELLTSATLVSDLMNRLREKAPAHTGPWYFQAVVRTEVRDKVPTNSRLVALRLVTPSK